MPIGWKILKGLKNSLNYILLQEVSARKYGNPFSVLVQYNYFENLLAYYKSKMN